MSWYHIQTFVWHFHHTKQKELDVKKWNIVYCCFLHAFISFYSSTSVLPCFSSSGTNWRQTHTRPVHLWTLTGTSTTHVSKHLHLHNSLSLLSSASDALMHQSWFPLNASQEFLPSLKWPWFRRQSLHILWRDIIFSFRVRSTILVSADVSRTEVASGLMVLQ